MVLDAMIYRSKPHGGGGERKYLRLSAENDMIHFVF